MEDVRFLYDGDGSEPGNEPFQGPPGSGLIEEIQDSWFQSKGQETDRVPFDGRSDYVGFTDRGIPAGGIFAGAEGIKTAAQEAVYGGDAGSWYDPCYTVWYFSSTKNPWGDAKAKPAKVKKYRKRKRVERWGYGWY